MNYLASFFLIAIFRCAELLKGITLPLMSAQVSYSVLLPQSSTEIICVCNCLEYSWLFHLDELSYLNYV